VHDNFCLLLLLQKDLTVLLQIVVGGTLAFTLVYTGLSLDFSLAGELGNVTSGGKYNLICCW